MEFTQNDLDRRLETMRNKITVECEMTSPLASGVPASDDGLRAFIEHHLGIAPESAEFEKCFSRIRNEEMVDTTPETGEVKTEEVYAVNVIRRTENGPFIAAHQIQALLKQAASRLGLFQKKKGSKGDMAEMGTVTAAGDSARDDRPDRIYVYTGPSALEIRPECHTPDTMFEAIHGCVGTPQGKKSIKHHTETVREGSRFSFSFHWPYTHLTCEDMQNVLAAATAIGIGSCLALGYGHFKIVKGEIK